MDKQLAFLQEIDKLKGVVRKTPLIDQSRKENSAEHSWHLAIYALILSESSSRVIDTDRVIRMLLIHDIVEIDAGDHPIHDTSANADQKALEQAAAQRIFGMLPDAQRSELLELWQEFEAGVTDDAAFAKALDRLQPLMHNVATAGGTWAEANVTEAQVKERYGRTIKQGSARLWAKAKALIEQHFA